MILAQPEYFLLPHLVHISPYIKAIWIAVTDYYFIFNVHLPDCPISIDSHTSINK